MNPQLICGIDATIPPRRDPGKGFKLAWPPLIKMDKTVKVKIAHMFNR